jgi:putative endonuclease
MSLGPLGPDGLPQASPGELEPRPHTRARGRAAEDLAVAWLECQGYRIEARNVVNVAGEIDVVARDGETLCFVEVKARATRSYGPAITAVDGRKQRRLARAAALYLAFQGAEGPCRFDVLGMDREETGEWVFTLLRDAFEGG